MTTASLAVHEFRHIRKDADELGTHTQKQAKTLNWFSLLRFVIKLTVKRYLNHWENIYRVFLELKTDFRRLGEATTEQGDYERLLDIRNNCTELLRDVLENHETLVRAVNRFLNQEEMEERFPSQKTKHILRCYRNFIEETEQEMESYRKLLQVGEASCAVSSEDFQTDTEAQLRDFSSHWNFFYGDEAPDANSASGH